MIVRYPKPWDDWDTRYVRNGIIVGAAIALVTETTRFVLERLGKHLGQERREWRRRESTIETLRNSVLMHNGYVLVFVGKEHPLAHRSGYAYEHRVVMMKKLGRILLPTEIVHHINGKRADNREKNLELYPSRWHHNAKHRHLAVPRQDPDQENERVVCACGCGRALWRFDVHHVERRFISGHNCKKLNERDVRHIRASYDRGAKTPALAAWYGVSQGVIVRIVRGRVWRNVVAQLVRGGPALEDLQRKKKEPKTHCIHGHQFTEKNTRLKKTRRGVSRICRACHRIREAARRSNGN